MTMAHRHSKLHLVVASISLAVVTAPVVAFLIGPSVRAQNQQIRERIAELKQSMAQNKQALAQYTWQEQQTIMVKGEVKKQTAYLVRIGPDGKQQKTEIGVPDQSSDEGRRHGLKHRIVEKKKTEFEDYAKQIAALAHSYLQQEPGRVQQLYQQGNVMLGSAGALDDVRIVIQNYVKQGDSVTITFSKPQQAIRSIQIASYLSDPTDAVKISAQFAQLPNGPNHASDVNVNGVSKQLTVEIQNSNYEHL
jgi:hypothetical protein